MATFYNRIAGQSVERLAAISDGLFAVAMTLLLLDVRLPSPASIHSEHGLWLALVALAPRFVVSFLSFLTGALLCVFNTYWSIAFIILVQLNYVFAPRIGILSRI
jgi:uncharacterized membrane protein